MVNNFTINLDRLELMLVKQVRRIDFFGEKSDLDLTEIEYVSAQDEYAHGGYTLTRRAKVQGKYKLQYDVLHAGAVVGNVRLLPTSPRPFFDGKPLVHFKVEKSLLYTDRARAALLGFLAVFSLKINNIRYYEIALDTNADLCGLFAKHFHSPTLWFMSKDRTTEKVLKVSTLYRDKSEVASYYVGERGGVQVVFYPKSKAAVYESFIRAFHAANGMNIEEVVNRAEVRVPRKAFKTYKTIYRHGKIQLSIDKYNKLSPCDQLLYTKRVIHKERVVTLNDLFDPTQLLALYKMDFTDLVDFRMKNRKQKARCCKLKMVDFSRVVEDYTYTTTEKDSMNMDTNLKKEEIKASLKLYKSRGKVFYWEEAQDIAQGNGLEYYFDEVAARLLLAAPAPTLADLLL